jgi:hydroxymethylbilane synthase
MNGNQIILGTRGSELALKQTSMVTALLQAAHPFLEVSHTVIQTTGDKRQDLKLNQFGKDGAALVDKGIFIKELEVALESKQIHAAVHSLKDLPSELEQHFAVAAVLERAPIEDVLISAGKYTLNTLPQGATVGTSSVRRARQLHLLRPDVKIVDLRGNVPTRVRKCLGENALDAIILAAAGLMRLDLLKPNSRTITIDDQKLHAQILDPTKFLPAAGQGAIAIEVNAKDGYMRDVFAKINHPETEARIKAEREFLRLLGAGCQTPVGAHSWIEGRKLHMTVRVFSEDSLLAPPMEATAAFSIDSPLTLARRLADRVR